MNRKILIILVIVNTAILFWGARNYILLTNASMSDLQQQVSETPPLVLQSLEIMKSYNEDQKIEHVNKIIHLYSKVADHLDAIKGVTLEAIDSLYNYVYLYFAVSLINIILLLSLFREPRHNKSPTLTGADNAPPG